jgi:hypothetical protein
LLRDTPEAKHAQQAGIIRRHTIFEPLQNEEHKRKKARRIVLSWTATIPNDESYKAFKKAGEQNAREMLS